MKFTFTENIFLNIINPYSTERIIYSRYVVYRDFLNIGN